MVDRMAGDPPSSTQQFDFFRKQSTLEWPGYPLIDLRVLKWGTGELPHQQRAFQYFTEGYLEWWTHKIPSQLELVSIHIDVCNNFEFLRLLVEQRLLISLPLNHSKTGSRVALSNYIRRFKR
ncbi:hypothetical protein PROFUN_00246 [Planoprotostelium fungivorum]|uniref:Uncharacterized protein n=1 Tax=Planoprotostelium fungivorum TaxID=1890364 RepID=A0A2P6NXY5_9EUKA|nr:hypothetical protein PROFUN_00246 [Planoprotostelium fungivorum]